MAGAGHRARAVSARPPRHRASATPATSSAGWRDRAACRGADLDLFFPGRGESAEPARRICARCPVRQPCLEFALCQGIVHGIWGGLAERDRRTLRTRWVGASRRERDEAIVAAAAAGYTKAAIGRAFGLAAMSVSRDPIPRVPRERGNRCLMTRYRAGPTCPGSPATAASSASRACAAGPGPDGLPARLIAVAAWLLALTGGGSLFVSFSAQYAYIFTVRRQGAASVIEALLLDLLMIVFTLLALGLSRAGRARAERALILACAVASAYMNVSAADVASPRSVAAYAVAPLALAVVVDRTVAVIRRHVLADQEPSAWTTPGRAAAAAARITGLMGVVLSAVRPGRPADGQGAAPDGAGRRPAARAPRGARARGNRPAPNQEGCTARLVPRPPGLRGPEHSQPGRRRTGPARRAAGRNRPHLSVRRARRQAIMTAPAEPSPRTVGEGLAAQVAALRGQVYMINARLDQAGFRDGLNLAARFEDLAQTVTDALEAALPRARRSVLDRPGPRHLHHPDRRPAAMGGHGAPPALRRLRAPRLLARHIHAIWSCRPWPPSGTASTAGHAPTWPGPWSSTTGGCRTPCAASPPSPPSACRTACCSAAPVIRLLFRDTANTCAAQES